MTLRAGTLLQPLFLHLPALQQKSFKNHQKWEINRDPDFSAGSPLLRLKDPHGITHEVKDFILENLDSNLEDALNRATTPEGKEQIICEYLCQRLAKATSFQVHVETFYDEESHKSHHCLRLGGYGLKGGGQDDDKMLGGGKKTALALSAIQICVGVIIIACCSRKLKLSSSMLLSMGTAGASYSYHLKTDQKFTWSQWSAYTAFGGISGIVSGVCDYLSQGAHTAIRVFAQTVGSMVGSGVPNVIAYRLEGKPLDKKFIQSMKISAVGGLVNATTGEVFNILRSENGGLLKTVGLQALKGTASSILSKQSTHYCEGKEVAWEDYMEAVVLGGGLSALTAFADFWRSSNKLQELQGKKTVAAKQLAEIKDRHAANKLAARQFSERLRQSFKKLTLKQEALKTLENKQTETSFKTLQESIEAAREEISMILKQISQDEKSLATVIQTCEDLTQQLPTLSIVEQHLNKSHEALSRNFEDKIRAKLDKGVKVKIHGRVVKDPATIREALVNGERVKWAMKGASSGFHRITDRLLERHPLGIDYRRGLHRLSREIKALIRMEDQLELYQTELGIATDLLRHSQGSPTDFPAPSAASSNSSSSNSSYSAETQVVQDHLSKQISNLKLQMSELQAQLPEARQQVELGRNHIAKLEGEIKALGHDIQGISIENAKAFQGNNSSWLPKNKIGYEPKALQNALKKESHSITFTDCTMQELIPHVVLVHGLNQTQPPGFIAEQVSNMMFENAQEACLLYIKNMMRPNGTIGHHLNLTHREFNGGLEDRPQLHWSWNQLVQPNGTISPIFSPNGHNCWEEAKFAILEPLSTFESTAFKKPYAVAPYDTFTFDSHQPSAESIILVAESIFEGVKKYLSEFQGKKIVPFKGPLRPAVIDALQAYYPEAWHICDESGNLTGNKMKYSPMGYYQKTCVKKPDGQVIVLITEKGDQESQRSATVFKEYFANKRYIGLHHDQLSLTVWLEDNDPYKRLKEFKENHIFVKGNPFFAGGIKEINGLKQWDIFESLKFYHHSQEKDAKTGVGKVATYVINEAMYADLVSLFFETHPTQQFDLLPLDLNMIFETRHVYLRTLLEDIKNYLTSTDGEKQQKAWEFFGIYCDLLKGATLEIKKAKQEALEWVNQPNAESSSNSSQSAVQQPLCLLIAQDEWKKVEVPTCIEFDLGKEYPLGERLEEYGSKVLRTLPSDLEQLQQVYQYLSFRLEEVQAKDDRNEQYRLNIIRSIIQWAVQEKIYRESVHDEGSSLLAKKLYKSTGWLNQYGLDPEDFTVKAGDCLFDNIAAQLPGGLKISKQLRVDAVTYLSEHNDEFSTKFVKELLKEDGESIDVQGWADYLKIMSMSQVWGTELEIHALAAKLDRPIVILSDKARPISYNPQGIHPPIFLNHVDNNHFLACTPFKGLDPKDIYRVITEAIEKVVT